MKAVLERLRPWQGPLFLIGGSAWDWATLDRIDRLRDNLLLLAYLAGLGVLLALELRVERKAWVPQWLVERRSWLHNASQFLFGGLFSAYVIFYSMSATAGRALFFVGLLAALLVVNELAERQLRGAFVRMALFFFCCFSFLLFFLPVVSGQLLGFVPAGIGAVAMATSVVAASWIRIRDGDPPPQVHALRPHVALWIGLWVVLSGMVRLGWVPPVPLALMEIGMFHDVERTDDGYRLTWEDPGPVRRWVRDHDATFRWTEGERVWCFTAVFAPSGMAIDVVHRWELWDEERGWSESNRIPFDVKGGRGAGYRGYTWKRHLRPGRWRVVVETPDGRELGRVSFDVVHGEAIRPLVERLY